MTSYLHIMGHMEACRYRCSEWRRCVVVHRLTPLPRRLVSSCPRRRRAPRLDKSGVQWMPGAEPAMHHCLLYLLFISLWIFRKYVQPWATCRRRSREYWDFESRDEKREWIVKAATTKSSATADGPRDALCQSKSHAQLSEQILPQIHNKSM